MDISMHVKCVPEIHHKILFFFEMVCMCSMRQTLNEPLIDGGAKSNN